MSAEESSASAEGVCYGTAGSLGLSTPQTRQKRKSIMRRSASPAPRRRSRAIVSANRLPRRVTSGASAQISE
eukprot:595007-Rhodomonas_salina.1